MMLDMSMCSPFQVKLLEAGFGAGLGAAFSAGGGVSVERGGLVACVMAVSVAAGALAVAKDLWASTVGVAFWPV